jgi:hypothetical protein
MALVPFVGYVRDNTGAGVTDALVAAYAVTNLSTNAKGTTPLVTTYPAAGTGRWTLNVETNNSSTGIIAIKISRGTTVRWIEGDDTMQAQRFFGIHGTAPILDNAITDAMFGSRTISDATAPTTNAGTPSALWGGVANRIKAITGASFWYSAPVASLVTIWNKFASTVTGGGHSHVGTTGNGPKLDPTTALIWVPARDDHTHASTGGSTTSNNADFVRGVDGRRMTYLQNFRSDVSGKPSTLGGPHVMQFGTETATTNSSGEKYVTFPSFFPSGLMWVMASNGDTRAYRGTIGAQEGSRQGFTMKLGTNESRTVRVNWIAIGW